MTLNQLENDTSLILSHDLHKLRIEGALAHKSAMPNSLAQRADAVAAWLGRGSEHYFHEQFEVSNYRKSLIFPLRNPQVSRRMIGQHRAEIKDLFKESDPYHLHEEILVSKLLNFYKEAREYPYGSLKYHILLTCAIYYNFYNNYKLKDLYLCENVPVDCPFQIIYRDAQREWSLIPHRKTRGMSRVWDKFHKTWMCRRKICIGGEHRVLDGLLSCIGSWTVALTTIDDFGDFLCNIS